MIEQTTRYGIGTVVALPYGEAVARVRRALSAEGFGVLTEIDVAATMKQKLGIEFRPYVILGACNPLLAHQALSAELEIGLLLPCNVVVYQADDPGHSMVAALDPLTVLPLSDNDAVRPLAAEVRRRLERALNGVQQTPMTTD